MGNHKYKIEILNVIAIAVILSVNQIPMQIMVYWFKNRFKTIIHPCFPFYIDNYYSFSLSWM